MNWKLWSVKDERKKSLWEETGCGAADRVCAVGGGSLLVSLVQGLHSEIWQMEFQAT